MTLRDLALEQVPACLLPGFIGPVPPPLLMSNMHIQLSRTDWIILGCPGLVKSWVPVLSSDCDNVTLESGLRKSVTEPEAVPGMPVFSPQEPGAIRSIPAGSGAAPKPRHEEPFVELGRQDEQNSFPGPAQISGDSCGPG